MLSREGRGTDQGIGEELTEVPRSSRMPLKMEFLNKVLIGKVT